MKLGLCNESPRIKPCNGRKMYDKSAVLITSQRNSRPSFTKNMFVILLMNASIILILLVRHLFSLNLEDTHK